MFVMIPCLKSVGLLFDLSLHSNLFHSTEQTYLLYVVSKWFKYSYILMSSEIQKRNMTQLTLQYIFLKYWGLKTAIAELNSDFEKSPDFIRLHVCAFHQFQESASLSGLFILYWDKFPQKITYTSSTYKKFF